MFYVCVFANCQNSSHILLALVERCVWLGKRLADFHGVWNDKDPGLSISLVKHLGRNAQRPLRSSLPEGYPHSDHMPISTGAYSFEWFTERSAFSRPWFICSILVSVDTQIKKQNKIKARSLHVQMALFYARSATPSSQRGLCLPVGWKRWDQISEQEALHKSLKLKQNLWFFMNFGVPN